MLLPFYIMRYEKHAKEFNEDPEKLHRLLQQGIQKGEERLSILINRLILDGRSSQIQVIVNDKQEREKAYKEYHI